VAVLTAGKKKQDRGMGSKAASSDAQREQLLQTLFTEFADFTAYVALSHLSHLSARRSALSSSGGVC
jgi:hypothetical protein